jgi:superoxide dismutase, Fe-Mn family
MPFSLMDLPFDEDALAPVMSAETISFHHGKHHKAYVDKTNELLDGKKDLVGATVSEVARAAHKAKDQTLFHNAAQLWNHNFFWMSLSPEGGKPSAKLHDLISDSFDSVEGLLNAMQKEATEHFSNGWVWLLLDKSELKVSSFHDADSPVTSGGAKPLLTLDVWEHAYYIDYRNDKPGYADAVLAERLNWAFAAQNLDGEGVRRADQPAGQ